MQICTIQQENGSQNVQKHNKTIPICDFAEEDKCNKHTWKVCLLRWRQYSTE